MNVEEYQKYLQLKENVKELTIKLIGYEGTPENRNKLVTAHNINKTQFDLLKGKLKTDKFLVREALIREMKYYKIPITEGFLRSLVPKLNLGKGKTVESTIKHLFNLGTTDKPFKLKFKYKIKYFLIELLNKI